MHTNMLASLFQFSHAHPEFFCRFLYMRAINNIIYEQFYFMIRKLTRHMLLCQFMAI